jgi:hypothetical protein
MSTMAVTICSAIAFPDGGSHLSRKPSRLIPHCLNKYMIKHIVDRGLSGLLRIRNI